MARAGGEECVLITKVSLSTMSLSSTRVDGPDGHRRLELISVAARKEMACFKGTDKKDGHEYIHRGVFCTTDRAPVVPWDTGDTYRMRTLVSLVSA
jgi:hypothetical protein